MAAPTWKWDTGTRAKLRIYAREVGSTRNSLAESLEQLLDRHGVLREKRIHFFLCIPKLQIGKVDHEKNDVTTNRAQLFT